ncbi:MAG: hypothetical protein FJ297_19295 [Planctomycetes bacterium]|nr:hypothetical protein [Planctomycetota bacterium]
MARIFLVLAPCALGLLAVNLVIGLSIGDLNGVSRRLVESRRALSALQVRGGAAASELDQAHAAIDEASTAYRPVRDRYRWHSLCGIAASLVTVFVNSVVVTYFIGTSRWCREVVETYQMPVELAARSQRLKRRTFPWALVGLAVILAIITLGASSDPGANYDNGAAYVTFHFLAAAGGLAVLAVAFWNQFVNIAANYDIIEEILGRVRDAQSERASAPNGDRPSAAREDEPYHHASLRPARP